MRAVTIKEAKAHLNELIDAAAAGEQVVLMRGSKHVAAIVPISAEDIELATTLSDRQAERFWQELAAERSRGETVTVATPEAAVSYLADPAAATGANEPGPRYGTPRPRKKGPPARKAGR